MSNKFPPFKVLVQKAWGDAIAVASHNIGHYRKELIESLKSPDPEERSAAVISFNEADDETAHDYVIKLVDDQDSTVRMEVFEYLEEFAKTDDIKLIFRRIKDDLELIHFKTSALQKITGREKGLILDDDPAEEIESEIQSWGSYLKAKGYI